ncbi:hypothetical protein AVEN_26295-1 [Araneus ventricosus]|uniref:Uncharacterized protein n=1 Tax=Araneus ventricosus TaxID=182803 RepID=A0A4Y2ANP1_ARAVE|nr:hypothetical protein AVEN_26295-1 [Araneus ventricosus]
MNISYDLTSQLLENTIHFPFRNVHIFDNCQWNEPCAATDTRARTGSVALGHLSRQCEAYLCVRKVASYTSPRTGVYESKRTLKSNNLQSKLLHHFEEHLQQARANGKATELLAIPRNVR